MKKGFSSRTKEIFAGIFLILVLAFVLVSVYQKKQYEADSDDFYLNAVFNKVDGIVEGARVRLAGIDVGYVSNLELDRYFRVKTTLTFNHEVQLPTDTGAIIKSDGLACSKYIELDAGGDEEFLAKGDFLAYPQDALRLDELLGRFLDWMRIKKGIKSEIEDRTEGEY